jgi:hypothetical protein
LRYFSSIGGKTIGQSLVRSVRSGPVARLEGYAEVVDVFRSSLKII